MDSEKVKSAASKIEYCEEMIQRFKEWKGVDEISGLSLTFIDNNNIAVITKKGRTVMTLDGDLHSNLVNQIIEEFENEKLFHKLELARLVNDFGIVAKVPLNNEQS